MKDQRGFTLFEVVITLLLIVIVLSFVAVVTMDPFLYFDKHIVDLQNVYQLKMVMENITHDYVNRCFSNTDFNLNDLQKRIGDANAVIFTKGSKPDNYHPYGYIDHRHEYVKYFVKFNDFVKEDVKDRIIRFEKINENSSKEKKNLLLVTLHLYKENQILDTNLTALFTQKKKQKK